MLLMGEALSSAARAHPHRVAATLDDEAIAFSALDTAADRTANALAGLGVTAGDRVAHWAGTSLRSIEIFAALAKLGAVFAPLNTAFGEQEARTALEYLEPRLVVADAERADLAAALAKDMGLELAIAGPGSERSPGADLDVLTAQAAPRPPVWANPDEHAVHAIFLTSGSTGRPKGVMLSHRASWLRAYLNDAGTSWCGGGGTVSMFPLFHWAGWQYVMYGWQSRTPVHMVRRAEAPALLREIERHRAEKLYAIPAVWARILEHRDPGIDTSSLRCANTGTSVTPPELLAAIKEAFPGTRTTVSYGSTEAGQTTSLGDEMLFAKPFSVGPPVSGCVVRLADDGEVLVRNEAMMSGYFNLPEETARALQDGWYHTGDLGALDEDGFLSITGRKREIIRSGAETIAPVEVEQAVLTYPGVAEAAVVGLEDARWGEVVCAVVVMEDGCAPPTVDRLRAHLQGRLAPPKHPRRILAVRSLPHTDATGQIRRSLLREQIVTGTLDAVTMS